MTTPDDADSGDDAVAPTDDAARSAEHDAASTEPTEKTTIRAGRNFETTYRLDADAAGEFLIDLGEALRAGDELTLAADEWELPFAFGEPVELEVDFDGVDEPELEIELELPGRPDETAPDVR